MIYHAFVTLENDQVISVLKRVSRANNKEVWEFAAFAHTEELERFDEYAWPYFENGEEIHWRDRFHRGDSSTQVFEGIPHEELKAFFDEMGIDTFRGDHNEHEFVKDFIIGAQPNNQG